MSSEAGTAARILKAALICAQDRPDFSMAQVAQGAGVSRQAVYLYYPDRVALLAALRHRLAPAPGLGGIEQALSARAALSAFLAGLAETYPSLWPVLRAARTTELPERLEPCRALVARFREEGALAPHLARGTVADILFSLTSPALWHDLTQTRGWDAGRYRSHIGYLAVSALTK
jgi:AcrR family transcriptional regulator